MQKIQLLIIITCLKIIRAISSNTGLFNLRGENLKFLHWPPIYKKNISSLIECHNFCLQHKPTCRSFNAKEHIGLNIHECHFFDKKKRPKDSPEQFESAINTLYFSLSNADYKVESCEAWKNIGFDSDGVYPIMVDGATKNLYCEMESYGGTWLVVQRRNGNGENFNRPWRAFKIGFGDLNDEFWLGNKFLYQLTRKPTDILVFAEDENGNQGVGIYSNFSIGSSKENYQVNKHLVYHSGLPGLHKIAGMEFSTAKFDNDKDAGVNCSAKMKGSWWYNACGNFILNAESDNRWDDFVPLGTIIKKTKIMIRN